MCISRSVVAQDRNHETWPTETVKWNRLPLADATMLCNRWMPKVSSTDLTLDDISVPRIVHMWFVTRESEMLFMPARTRSLPVTYYRTNVHAEGSSNGRLREAVECRGQSPTPGGFYALISRDGILPKPENWAAHHGRSRPGNRLA